MVDADISAAARRRSQFAAVAALAICLFAGWLLSGTALSSRIQSFGSDLMQRTLPRPVTELPVVIVDIDEASLARHGQWPWPRTRLADLLTRIGAAAPAAIGLDMVLAESDRLSPGNVVADRGDLSPALRAAIAALPSNDDILAERLAALPVVVGNAGLPDATATSARDPVRTPVRLQAAIAPGTLRDIGAILQNVAPIESAARGRGLLNAVPDPDGTIRRVPLLMSHRGEPVPSLALEMLRLAVGAPVLALAVEAGRPVAAMLGDARLALPADGLLPVHFSRADPRRRVSAAEVMDGKVAPEHLNRRLVLVGVTALGLADAPPTPVAGRMDGVEIQAQVLENLLAGRLLERPAAAGWLEAAAATILALALALGQSRLAPSLQAGAAAVAILAIGAAAFAAYATLGLLLDPVSPAAAVAVAYLAGSSTMLVESERRRRELDRALQIERIEAARVAGELDAARDIQLGMLPTDSDLAALPPSVAVAARLQPAREVGGDLFDAFMIDERRLFFIVGDVSGKGVPASLFMAVSKVLCKSVALRGGGIDTMLAAANREVSRENPAIMFVTAFAGLLDTTTGELEFCNAGHEPPIVLRPSAPPAPLEGEGGPPLCAIEDFPYPTERHRMTLGETLLVITDGITEARAMNGELFGRQRLVSLLADVAEQPVDRLAGVLIAQVDAFQAGVPPADDVTLLALRYLGPVSAP